MGCTAQCLLKPWSHTLVWALQTKGQGNGPSILLPPLEPKLIWLLLYSCLPSTSFSKACWINLCKTAGLCCHFYGCINQLLPWPQDALSLNDNIWLKYTTLACSRASLSGKSWKRIQLAFPWPCGDTRHGRWFADTGGRRAVSAWIAGRWQAQMMLSTSENTFQEWWLPGRMISHARLNAAWLCS